MNKIPAVHEHTILSGNLSPTTKSITKILGINNDYSLKQPWSPWNLLYAVVMHSSYKFLSDITTAAEFLNVIQILISFFKVSATVYCDTNKKMAISQVKMGYFWFS